ncbi:MAG: hypothetical protein VX475_01515 [Myxococcota bacterium]|nr:hypothetical protein [Myxococcota bacterium]
MPAMIRCLITLLLVLLVCGCGPKDEDSNSSTANQQTTTSTRISAQGYDRVRDARFSPDGARLVLVGESGQDEVAILTTDLEGGDVQVLVDEGLSYLSTVAWSPDGAQVYYSGDGGIYRIAASGGEPELVVDAFAVLSLDVARDGSRIAWSENGPNSVNVAPLDAIPVTTDNITYGPSGFNPRFSPDSARLIYTQFEGDAAIYKLAAADLSGEPEDVAGQADYLSNAAWVDDDTVLMFDNDRIVERSLTGEDVRELTDAFAGTGLDVSHDGANFIHGANGQSSLELESR